MLARAAEEELLLLLPQAQQSPSLSGTQSPGHVLLAKLLLLLLRPPALFLGKWPGWG